MKGFDEILRNATSEIATEYFQLPIDGRAPIYRECVYTYELYHQLRRHWPEDGPFRLNGEVDKRAHPLLSQLDMRLSIPDLLVHAPGVMAFNYAVMEVKPQTANAGGVQKDIHTLSQLVTVAGYRRAIYLHYGYSIPETLLAQLSAEAQKIKSSQIEVWFHRAPMEAAAKVTVIQGNI